MLVKTIPTTLRMCQTEFGRGRNKGEKFRILLPSLRKTRTWGLENEVFWANNKHDHVDLVETIPTTPRTCKTELKRGRYGYSKLVGQDNPRTDPAGGRRRWRHHDVIRRVWLVNGQRLTVDWSTVKLLTEKNILKKKYLKLFFSLS